MVAVLHVAPDGPQLFLWWPDTNSTRTISVPADFAPNTSMPPYIAAGMVALVSDDRFTLAAVDLATSKWAFPALRRFSHNWRWLPWDAPRGPVPEKKVLDRAANREFIVQASENDPDAYDVVEVSDDTNSVVRRSSPFRLGEPPTSRDRVSPLPMLCYSAQASLVTVLYYAPGGETNNYNLFVWWPEQGNDHIVPLPEGMTPNSHVAPVINADDGIVQVIADDDTTCATLDLATLKWKYPARWASESDTPRSDLWTLAGSGDSCYFFVDTQAAFLWATESVLLGAHPGYPPPASGNLQRLSLGDRQVLSPSGSPEEGAGDGLGPLVWTDAILGVSGSRDGERISLQYSRADIRGADCVMEAGSTTSFGYGFHMTNAFRNGRVPLVCAAAVSPSGKLLAVPNWGDRNLQITLFGAPELNLMATWQLKTVPSPPPTPEEEPYAVE